LGVWDNKIKGGHNSDDKKIAYRAPIACEESMHQLTKYNILTVVLDVFIARAL